MPARLRFVFQQKANVDNFHWKKMLSLTEPLVFSRTGNSLARKIDTIFLFFPPPYAGNVKEMFTTSFIQKMRSGISSLKKNEKIDR